MQSDFLSRCSIHENPSTKEIMFLTHFPVDRNKLILETKLAFPSVISSIKNGWSNSSKKRFPLLYKRRNELSLSPDGLIFVSDLPFIPPVCREEILVFLHSGHMGHEKTKSLARMT